MLFRMSRLAAALAVGLMVASGASAAPIFSDDNTGVTTIKALGSGAYVVDIWLDVDGNAVSAAGVVVNTTGGISFTANVTCVVGGCASSQTPGFPNSGPQSASVNFNVDQTTDFLLASFTINVGASAGTMTVDGYWDDASFNSNVLPTFTLVQSIPEPGTLLLLGSGLVGLTLVGRRRA